MPEWPEITIMICTYDRPLEARRTIKSLCLMLQYPPEKLKWHIADDGTADPNYVKDLAHFIKRETSARYEATWTITDRQGWGKNVNKGLGAIDTDYVYFTEDDYVLKRTLHLQPHVAVMEMAPAIGLTRFGIAGHGVTGHLNEVDIRTWLPDYNENGSNSGYNGQGRVNTWVLDRQSVGPYSFYLYSNRPHLKHRRFHQAYGLYVEGQTLANTEHAMNHQFRQGPEIPYIVCPANWTLWHFDHIGVSRQGTAEDIHATA